MTKPSFMTNLSILDKSEILFFVGSLAIILSELPLGILFLISRIPFFRKYEKLFFFIGAAVPAGILSALVLILVDNFTYTLFRFGIVSTQGILRGVYALCFLIVFVWIYRNVLNTGVYLENKIQKQKNKMVLVLFLVVFLAGTISIPYFRHGSLQRLIPESKVNSTTSQLPNIILITSDGLNADHMSIYGYERDTTPFLRSVSKSSLIAENAFTNSANTTGSIISILTSKDTTTTRVLYPPDILTNLNSYEHLPGILQASGYFTVEMGFGVYVDAYNQNLLNGFDMVNGRRFLGSKYFDLLNSYFPGQSAYFFYETFNRIFDRLRHIFYLNTMENNFEQITMVAEAFADSQKIEQLYGYFEQKEQPIFAHIHWMGTHGAKFFPEKQVFSIKKQKDLQMEWDLDFYDDSILELDQIIKGIHEKLNPESNDANTIIVIASDHGQHYVSNERLPLIFLFPNGEFSKTLSLNAQNLDIAPTLLDYLGLAIPEWMQGTSLLNGLEKQRPIFATGVGRTTVENGWTKVDTALSKPPFYQFGFVSMIYCDHWYQLSFLDSFSFAKAKVDSYNTSCTNEKKSDMEILHQISDHLKENRFDTGELENWITNYSSD
ncbi:MAG: sulfatase-like hydrolase/transferase [Anaerolineaceae bacterium]